MFFILNFIEKKTDKTYKLLLIEKELDGTKFIDLIQ